MNVLRRRMHPSVISSPAIPNPDLDRSKVNVFLPVAGKPTSVVPIVSREISN
jgi:hypothetical protein